LDETVLIDTNIVLDFFREGASGPYTEIILGNAKGAISVLSIYELLNGVKKKDHLAQRKQFIGHCNVISFDEVIALKASNIYSQLKKEGSLMDHIDIFIGATALTKNFQLFTKNYKNFKRIKGLKLYEM
jgi:tRNA(fMet)-specific endonuclease VapC